MLENLVEGGVRGNAWVAYVSASQSLGVIYHYGFNNPEL